MSIQDMRDGLEANLQTIDGLRANAEIPDNPNPPVAIVALDNVDYDQAFQNGLVLYRFRVDVIVSRASDRWAQRRLDEYTSTGSSSVKAAIESDKTLGGSAFDVRVVQMDRIGTVSLGEVTYLAASFAVEVYSS